MSQGANRSYGDAYGTYYNPNPTLNNQYDYRGYQYTIDVPVGAGATNVDLYDPTFCAVDDNKGTGDHWIDGADYRACRPTTRSGPTPPTTPLDYTDDVQVATSGTPLRGQAPGGQEPRPSGHRP